MSKATPGPWRVTRILDTDTMKETNYRVCSVNPDKLVAHVSVESKGRNEQGANAALIAAAPELLEALEAAIEHGGTTSGEWMPTEVYAQMRAAIAKARAQ